MHRKRILIADDEEQTCFCISMALKIKGFSTVVAENGEKALQIITEQKKTPEPIDLLICDIEMPKVNGEELIDKLNAMKIKIPKLVITGFGEKELVVRLMRKGCRDFIDKPFQPDEIGKRVEMIFAEDADDELEQKRMETLANVGLRTRQLVHDMNNVLAGTLGYADLALDSVDDTRATQKYLTKLMKSASRAAEICQNLLTATRCKAPPAFVPTEMNSLVQRAAAILTDVVARDIVVETKTDSAPLWCSANAERVQQALLNLGINAGQAMKDGGRLALSCAGIKNRSGRFVRLGVTDSGCGIPEEILNKIFENGFSTRKNGNGIGLHTVKEIVDEHGATIKVASELGKGTTFTIDFCAQEAATASNERTSHEKA